MDQMQQLMNDPQRQQEFQDFANRYQQGDPTQGYSDQEAVQRFEQVAPQLPPQEFQQSAAQAFQQWSPDQRQEFGQYLQQRAQQQSIPMPQAGGPGTYQDPNALAQMVTQVHQQQPGMLSQLLGAGNGQSMGGQSMGGGSGQLLANPLAKAALAGIAAMAAQRMFSRR
ncbi:MAG TPA: hypothetical protein VF763_14380 [Candidatus Limnocylindrales bacterium]